jgi:hypothetical protein
MNDQRQEQLMRAARRVPAATPSDDFCEDVLRAIRQDARKTTAPASLADQLVALLPRLAAVTLVIITAAVAWEVFADGDFVVQLAEATDEWLLPMNWL